jgi:mRNA-degrading endonuclease RelE of RelBE toxin-antitoxin system
MSPSTPNSRSGTLKMPSRRRHELASLHSARRSDYRISTDGHQVEIVAIEHRAYAYRLH